jgi:hypothetical protein
MQIENDGSAENSSLEREEKPASSPLELPFADEYCL